MDRGFKFRVSYRLMERGASKERSIEFLYKNFKEARKNYKSILLSLYRNRSLVGYKICLNRTRDQPWQFPIFEDDLEA